MTVEPTTHGARTKTRLDVGHDLLVKAVVTQKDVEQVCLHRQFRVPVRNVSSRRARVPSRASIAQHDGRGRDRPGALTPSALRAMAAGAEGRFKILVCAPRSGVSAIVTSTRPRQKRVTPGGLFPSKSPVCTLASARRSRRPQVHAGPIRLIACVHLCVYSSVKRRDLERRLAALGWRLERRGARHDVWRRGERTEAVPRHTDVNDRLARAILARAERED